MVLVKTINDHYHRENSQTKVVEHIPALEIELENRLTEDEKLDLQFDILKSYRLYQETFKKVFTFSSIEEMKLVKNIIDKMKELDLNKKSYHISEGLNCSLAIETDDAKSIFSLKSPQLMAYVKEIVAWMDGPLRYHGA